MKTLSFKEYGFGRYDDVSPFPLGDLKLQITGLPNYTVGEFRFQAFINGKEILSHTVYPKNENLITISQSKLAGGRFTCHVSYFVKGHETKRFHAEDLVITALNKDLVAFPEISNLEIKVETLQKNLQDYLSTFNSFTKEIYEAMAKERAKIIALLKFAWTDYKNSVYLDGETFEDFISAFGFDLTDEEKLTIKGDSKNETI